MTSAATAPKCASAPSARRNFDGAVRLRAGRPARAIARLRRRAARSGDLFDLHRRHAPRHADLAVAGRHDVPAARRQRAVSVAVFDLYRAAHSGGLVAQGAAAVVRARLGHGGLHDLWLADGARRAWLLARARHDFGLDRAVHLACLSPRAGAGAAARIAVHLRRRRDDSLVLGRRACGAPGIAWRPDVRRRVNVRRVVSDLCRAAPHSRRHRHCAGCGHFRSGDSALVCVRGG